MTCWLTFAGASAYCENSIAYVARPWLKERSAVTGFGIFVALDDVYVEGLVHISELGEDYYHFDAARHQLLGERTARRFRLADRVRVKLTRVDLDSSKIDFRLVEHSPQKTKRA